MTLVKNILFVCLLPFLGRGQTFFDNKYSTGFNNLLSECVITEKDSGFVFLNYILDSATGRQDIGLIRLDKLGNEKVKKSFNMFNEGYGAFVTGMNHFIGATKSSLFVTGGVYHNGHNNAVIINKINNVTLDTIKTVFKSDPLIGYFMSSFIRFNENKYYLIGDAGYTTGPNWPIIFHIDSALNIINTINVNNSSGFVCYSAVYNPNGKKILLAGNTSVPIGNNQPITLFHIDTLGVISKTIQIKTPTYLNGVKQAFYSPSDNSYVLLSVKQTGKYGNLPMSRICVTKFNATSLKLLWQKTYGDEGIENSAQDAVILNDGSIVISGSYSFLTSLPLMNADYGGFILKLDINGNVQWVRKYDHHGPGNHYECLFGIDRSKEHGFNLCGSITNLPKAKAWAMKVDSLGCVTSSNCPSYTMEVISIPYDTTEVIDTTSTIGIGETIYNNSKFYVYPNPTDEISKIVVRDADKENLVVKVTDIYGREIQFIEIETSGEQELDSRNYTPGIYLVKLYRNNTLISTLKLVKQ